MFGNKKFPGRLALILPLFLIIAACTGNGDQVGGSGLLEANEALVSSEIAGRTLTLFFDEGSQVMANDTLLIVDDSRLKLELASAKAGEKVVQSRLATTQLQLEQARETERFLATERFRVEELLKTGTATQRQFDEIDHQQRQATIATHQAAANIQSIERELVKIDADIARIDRAIEDCYPTAPLAGTVTEKYIDIGELLSPGKAIAKISRLDTLWVKVYLPSGDFANVKIGDQATLSTEAGGREYTASVVWTSDQAEFTPKNVQTEKSRANLVYAVKVVVENSDGSLKIGMPVYVTLK